MKQIHNSQKVIFLHIPKAGGQTVYRIVRKNVPEENIFQITGRESKESIESFKHLKSKRNISWLMGHMGFGLHRFFDEEATYLTFLRDPVKRLISYYNFVLRRPDHYLYSAIVSPGGRKMFLEEFVRTCPTTEIQNGQVRLLSSFNGNNNSDSVLGESDLQKAKENIDRHFTVVGILELFDLSLLLIKRLGLLTRVNYSKRNTARKISVLIDDKTISRILDINKLDMELYEYCYKNMMHRLENDPGLKRDLATFQKSNRIYRLCNIKGLIDRFQYRLLNRR